MKDNEILQHLKSSIDDAPIDILGNIKKEKIIKMEEHDEITRQKPNRLPLRPIMYLASAAAVFLVVFFNYQIQFIRPDSLIYLDVNPSIHITTNKRDDVISLDAVNPDGLYIIRDIDFKNKDMYMVTEEIIDSMTNKAFIEKEDEVMLLSIYNRDKEKSLRQKGELDSIIHEKLKLIDKNPILLTQSLDKSNTIDEFAEKYNISIGKMTFIRNLIILNPELETDDLVNLSMTELIVVARDNKLDIEKIIDSSDFERFPQGKSEPSNGIISPDEARIIALNLVNGRITDFEYDDDDFEYGIEILANGKEYEIQIDGKTGRVLKFEADDVDDIDDDDKPSSPVNTGKISEDEAKRIGLARVGGGKITEFEYDDGEYEIEIEYNGKEYDIEIDAYTGRIIKFEIEDDDDDD